MDFDEMNLDEMKKEINKKIIECYKALGIEILEEESEDCIVRDEEGNVVEVE